MSAVAFMDMDMTQLYVKTAFLYGPIDEEIYIEQPEGFAIPGKEKEVCKLKKCIYGLKQDSRMWNEHFSEFLRSHGFKASVADPCFFIRQRGNEATYLIIWVDYGIIASNEPASIKRAPNCPQQKVPDKISSTGKVRWNPDNER